MQSSRVVNNDIRLDMFFMTNDNSHKEDLIRLAKKMDELESFGWEPFYFLEATADGKDALAIYSRKLLIPVGFDPPIQSKEGE